jgi:hypothetical protein
MRDAADHDAICLIQRWFRFHWALFGAFGTRFERIHRRNARFPSFPEQGERLGRSAFFCGYGLLQSAFYIEPHHVTKFAQGAR